MARTIGLEKWLDTFDAHLVNVDILDYPGAEEAADIAVRVARHQLSSTAQVLMALQQDYSRKFAEKGRP